MDEMNQTMEIVSIAASLILGVVLLMVITNTWNLKLEKGRAGNLRCVAVQLTRAFILLLFLFVLRRYLTVKMETQYTGFIGGFRAILDAGNFSLLGTCWLVVNYLFWGCVVFVVLWSYQWVWIKAFRKDDPKETPQIESVNQKP